ncbi:MAG: hypothetical protein K6G52_04345 [Treponemataceae bacterium]|nr:hypothetical protein [Treponemataceae bacterium]
MQKTTFRLEDILTSLKKLKLNIDEDEIQDFLSKLPFLVKFIDGSYCSKAILLKYACFTIKPTKKEVDEKYLMIGHRTMPFTNPNLMPTDLRFYYNKKMINFGLFVLPNSEIQEHYKLFGDELIPQILSLDWANFYEPIENIFSPESYKTHISVLEMSDFYAQTNFHYGDRIVCVIKDWFQGTINIAPLSEFLKNPFQNSEIEELRKIWNTNFEESLLNVIHNDGIFEDMYGQLFAALLPNIKKLSTPFSGSVEELIESSEKLEIQNFGIENRIWEKGKPIIAIKTWDAPFTMVSTISTNTEKYGLADCINLKINETIIDQYLVDALANNEEDISKVISSIIPDFISVDPNAYKNLMLNLKDKSAKLHESYNKFADFPIAEIRHGALLLFSKNISLVHEIRLSTIDPATLSQQPLFMIMHIVEHLSKLLSIFLFQENLADDDLRAMKDSIEGMNYSFNENCTQILTELKERHYNLKLSSSNGEN